MNGDAWGGKPALDPGNDFELKFWSLLRRRYKPEDLVYLPATFGGDCGIEGFSRDGIAYQCYADRDSLTLRHRTDKQKDKLYDDTAKLQKYADRLGRVLGGTVIKNYFLLVPEFHAVELVEYANRRAEAVRAHNLPFIDANFRVHIKTPDDYPAELRAAVLDGAAQAIVPDPSVDDGHVALFTREKPELVTTLEDKLSGVAGVLGNVEGLRNSFIRAFLQKEQIMKALEAWPETWEAVERRRVLCQEEVEFDNEISTMDARARIRDLVSSYKAGLTSSAAGIREADAQRISFGQVGDWLMRCPLRLRRTP
ncbi:hypothetical protein ABZ754_00475 [Micromonospora purpureochromogenes]|uniref:hypothetical protein n=1 Tax=Micromonospora purpureochromogenes TaxID=47872 RepID=UPI0033CA0294